MKEKTRTVEELLVFHQQKNKDVSPYEPISEERRDAQVEFLIQRLLRHDIALEVYTTGSIVDTFNEYGMEKGLSFFHNIIHRYISFKLCRDITIHYCDVFSII